METDELYLLFCLLTDRHTATVAAAWRNARRLGRFSLSLASAYRWLTIFTNRIHFYRSKLFEQVHPPPINQKESASPNIDVAITLHMFDEANTNITQNAFSVFQLYHQIELY